MNLEGKVFEIVCGRRDPLITQLFEQIYFSRHLRFILADTYN